MLTNAREVTGLQDEELLAPVADDIPATLAELIFGVTHEGAADVDDLLDRRTRIGLVPVDRERAVATAERALALAGRPAQIISGRGSPGRNQAKTSETPVNRPGLPREWRNFGQPPMSFCRGAGLPLDGAQTDEAGAGPWRHS